jgi:hypothetical protein
MLACLPACQPIRPCFPCGVACLYADSLPFVVFASFFLCTKEAEVHHHHHQLSIA